MPDAPDAEVERLLAHSGWIRSLARELAHDPELADDLVQETWARALEHAPAEPRSLAGWLAQVMRNTLRQWRRGAHRRSARERTQARPEAGDEGGATVHRLELSRAVVDAVRALDEPIRTTVVLRYFEDLPPRRIASRLQVPVATVKSRLNRGHALLRGRLDRRFGDDRRGWLPALAAAFRLPPPATAPLTPVAAAPASGALVLAAAAVTVAVVLLLHFGEPPSREPRPTAARTDVAPIRHAAPAEGAASGAPARREAAEAEEPTSPPADPAARVVSGRVVDPDGMPVPGIAVHLRTFEVTAWPGPAAALRRQAARLDEPRPDDVVAEADAAGRFRLEAPPAEGGHLILFAGDATRSPAFAAVIRPGEERRERTVVAAPRAVVTGVVVDPADRPIECAAVSFRLPDAAAALDGVPLDGAVAAAPHVASGSDGRFRLEGPAVPGARVDAIATGHRPRSIARSDAAREEFRLVLEPERAEDGLTGVVVDAGGAPVADALVAAGGASTRTDERGRFRMSRALAAAAGALVAAAPGRLPARVELDGSAPVVLTLGGPPPGLAGRLVDANDRPLAGALVFTAEVTPLAKGDAQTPICVEHVLAGPDRPPPLVHARTDADGRFAIDGLLPRAYGLVALVGARRVALGRHAAGDRALLLRVGTASPPAPIRGAVLTPDGAPLGGVALTPVVELMTFPRPWSAADLALRVPGSPTVSDARGRFALDGLARERLWLQVGGEGVVPGFVPIPASDGGEVRVVAERACRLAVAATPLSRRSVRVEVLDRSRAVLDVLAVRGAELQPMHAVPLRDGRSEVVTAPESAHLLRFVGADGTTREIPVTLRPDRLTTVRAD